MFVPAALKLTDPPINRTGMLRASSTAVGIWWLVWDINLFRIA